MGSWCTPTTAGGWAAMIVVRALALAVVLWALGRLLPVRHARADPPPPPMPAPAGTRAASPQRHPAPLGAPPAGS